MKLATTCLVESTDGRYEDDGIGVVKVGDPGVTLAARTTHIKQMPRYHFAMDIDVENMLRNTHSLDPRVQDIV